MMLQFVRHMSRLGVNMMVHQLRHRSMQAPRNINFFAATQQSCERLDVASVMKILHSKSQLDLLFERMDKDLHHNYIHKQFRTWLNAYAQQESCQCESYLQGDVNLNDVCQRFIRFCFQNNIEISPQATLESFEQHNHLSDQAVKDALADIKLKPEMDILGYGLDEGDYELSLKEYLLQQDEVEQVNVYGFDPFARKNPQISYLSAEALATTQHSFDLITARWVLHHVALKDRWDDLIRCIARGACGARVLIVEHGLLCQPHSLIETRLHHLCNAAYDVIANIGLRPDYTADHFFIHYLTAQDLRVIEEALDGFHFEVNDVGPVFPNQSVCVGAR